MGGEEGRAEVRGRGGGGGEGERGEKGREGEGRGGDDSNEERRSAGCCEGGRLTVRERTRGVVGTAL